MNFTQPAAGSAALCQISWDAGGVSAGPDASLYVLAQILIPDASLLIRCLATYLPDPALRQQLKVIIATSMA